MNLFLPGVDSEAVKRIEASDAMEVASESLLALRTAPIENEEQAAVVSDIRLALRNGDARIKNGLRDLFAPLKAFENRLRNHFAPATKAFGEGIERCDRLLVAWDDAKLAAERAARDKAIALSKTASAPDEFGGGLPVQQAVAPAIKQTRTETSTSTITGTLKCELVDALACAKEWPHLLKLTTQADAKSEFGKRVAPYGDEKSGGVVVGGIRFWTHRGVQTRRA